MRKKRKSIFNWNEKILILLWGGVDLSFSALDDLFDLFAYRSKRWGWNAQEELCTIQSLDRIIKTLKDEHLIKEIEEEGKHKLQLTHKGELAINWLTPPFEKPKGKWDGYWYLLVFDVPEEIRKARNLLRDKLYNLGFGRIQKSVFISPYNSLPIIENLAKQNKVDQYIRTMVVKKINNQKQLIEQAWPWPIMENKLRNCLRNYSGVSKKKNPFKLKELEKNLSKILKEDPGLPRELIPPSYFELKDKVTRLLKKLSA